MTTRFSVGLTLLLCGPAGCAAELETDPGDPSAERGSIGKADLMGTCQGATEDFCGGPSAGNCWCDEACVGYGDCCSDVDEVCGPVDPPPGGQGCGGFLGDTCSDDEYCAYEAGQYCGAADASATCQPRPEACITLYDPVCGCDGNTYGNACVAAVAGTGVLSEGACAAPPPGSFCGGIAGIQCPDGQVCVDDENDDCDPADGGADCGGVCVLEGEACAPVLCELFCAFGFDVDPETGCEVCACAEQPAGAECVAAGGKCVVGLVESCPEGLAASAMGCGDAPIETTCCAPVEPAPDSCVGACGGPAAGAGCWCDSLCESYGDCCGDFSTAC